MVARLFAPCFINSVTSSTLLFLMAFISSLLGIGRWLGWLDDVVFDYLYPIVKASYDRKQLENLGLE